MVWQDTVTWEGRIWVAFVSECSRAGRAIAGREWLETGLTRPRPTTSWLCSFCVYRNLGELVTIGSWGFRWERALPACPLCNHDISLPTS